MATPLPVFKNGILSRHTLGTTDLKLGMHIQLYSGSKIAGSHLVTFLPLICRAKIILRKHLDLGS